MSLIYFDLHSIPSTICECKSSVKSSACTKTYTIQIHKIPCAIFNRNLRHEPVHCKDKITKSPNKYSLKKNCRPQSQFSHSCVYARFIYSHKRSAFSAAGKYVDRSWEYINLSQTHECGIWG